jgi:hypothetical protein
MIVLSILIEFGNSEVYNIDFGELIVATNKNILWLEIPMNNRAKLFSESEVITDYESVQLSGATFQQSLAQFLESTF